MVELCLVQAQSCFSISFTHDKAVDLLSCFSWMCNNDVCFWLTLLFLVVIFNIIFCFELTLLFSLLICHCLHWSFVVKQFTVSSSSHPQSSSHINPGHFPHISKNFNQCSMPLLIIAIWHMPICCIHELLWACNIIFLFMDLFSLVHGSSILYFLMGIRLTKLLVPSSSLHISVICCRFCN